MSQTRKRWILSIAVFAVLACVAAAVYTLWPRDRGQSAAPRPTEQQPMDPLRVGEQFLAALERQNPATAAALTSDPVAAKRDLTAVNTALAPVRVSTAWTKLAPVPAGATEVVEPFTVSWRLDTDQVWTYESALPLELVDGRWRIRWSLTVVHPRLTSGLALAQRVAARPAAAVVDRDGTPMMTLDGTPTDPTVAPLLAGAFKRTVQSAPAAGPRVVLVDGGGAEVATLFGAERPAPVEPVTSTVSVAVQRAAQAAVDSVGQPAILVAVQPSTGGVVAVAQNAAAGQEPKAFNGLYPPGSTFKVVTATAALDAGKAGVDTVLPCPGRATIGTRTIKNADFELPDVPLRKAFAESCNTTFAALAADLPGDSLPAAAAKFGLAADFEIPGLTTQTGRVHPSGSTPEQVENSIGQGTVQVSPFGLALMAATVARGSAVTPRLYAGMETVVKTGYRAPSAATVGALRTMMREVVTGGRGRELAKHGAVSGKTGTAQFGDGERSHGWFAGYRGDLAFAVLVEDAGSAAPAVAVTGKFLSLTA